MSVSCFTQKIQPVCALLECYSDYWEISILCTIVMAGDKYKYSALNNNLCPKFKILNITMISYSLQK